MLKLLLLDTQISQTYTKMMFEEFLFAWGVKSLRMVGKSSFYPRPWHRVVAQGQLNQSDDFLTQIFHSAGFIQSSLFSYLSSLKASFIYLPKHSITVSFYFQEL